MTLGERIEQVRREKAKQNLISPWAAAQVAAKQAVDKGELPRFATKELVR